MKLKLIAVGKLKEKWLVQAVAEYQKRLSRFTTLDIVEVSDSPDKLEPAVAMKKEGERVLAKVSPSDYLVLVDLHGQEMDSIKFSETVTDWTVKSGGRVVFVIAGSGGFDQAIRQRANESVCLSKLTFPHQIVRVLLLEQLYRSFKIRANETYHK